MGGKRIVVVMGGTSTEAEVSRRTGDAILSALQKAGYEAEGLELVPENFAMDIREANPAIVFNALHGKFGEDGLLQGTLEMLGIPYTGSGVLAAAITMDKAATKRIFRAEGISTPKARSFWKHEEERDIVSEILKEFSLPIVVKATMQGSSIGVYIVETKTGLGDAIEKAFSFNGEILVEEFIRGREFTVAVWGESGKVEPFPVIEIATATGRYDYETKYKKGASSHIVPAEIPEDVAKNMQDIACHSYSACGCEGVARVDFMLNEQNKPYVIEVNSVPGMTETSLVPDGARAMGISFTGLCERILELAGYRK